jgi:hypothetical protein
MAIPRFTDLRGIARDLADDQKYRRLATSIQKAALAQSCLGDIRQSETCCDALDAILRSLRRAGTVERSATENALLATAVLLYARATSTSGSRGERGPIDISSKLDATQRTDHAALLKVRNRALAHVYTQEAVAEDIWHDDLLFLVETNHGWKPAAATHRIQYHKATLERLRRQLPIAGRLITEIFHKRINQVSELMTEHPVEWEIFKRNLFNPVDFFGSERAVIDALAGMPFGSAIGLASRPANRG